MRIRDPELDEAALKSSNEQASNSSSSLFTKIYLMSQIMLSSIMSIVFISGWFLKSSILHGVIGCVANMCLMYVYLVPLLHTFHEHPVPFNQWIIAVAVVSISAGLSDISIEPNVSEAFKGHRVAMGINGLWSAAKIMYVIYL